MQDTHNHTHDLLDEGTLDDGLGDPVHRRFADEQKRYIEGQYKIGNTAQAIVASLRATFTHPPIFVKAKDINYHILKIKLGKMDGFTGTQAFIKKLGDEGRPHRIVDEEADPNRIAGAFWTYPWCIECGDGLGVLLPWITHTKPTAIRCPS